ncbi:MAG: dienelactone hydrolase family protein [Magnetovibrio sp.]|nr:dienelactone hydrolase family protein [Magnetovibrio sp.]
MRALGGALAVFAALALAAGDAAAAKPLKVRFPSADAAGTLIGGLYYKPDVNSGRPGRRAGVIMLHGCAGMLTKSGKLKRRPKFWAEWLADQGYAVLLADSFNPRGFRSICQTAARPLSPKRDRPFDAYGALKFLQVQPEVNPGRIALMGWSNGAMTLLWAVREGAPARPADLTDGFRAAVAFYPGCIALGRKPYATDVPTLLQLGRADDWTPAAPCLKMVREAAGRGVPIEADAYDGAYHGFDNPALEIKTVVTRNNASKTKERRVHVGTDVAARVAAIERVRDFLATRLAE